MRTRSVHTLTVALGLAVLPTIPSAAPANMITNGSFESGPAMPPSGELQVPVGSTAITGWQVTRAPIELVSDVYWEAGQGVCSLGLNPTSTPGGIAQTFPTYAGVGYRVDFMLSGEPFTTPAVKWVRVSAAGQHADFSFDSSNNWHWAMGWAAHTWSFIANASSTTLEFASLTTAVASPVIDNVSAGLVTADVGRMDFALALSSPNPLRGAATFSFSLPSAGPAVLAVTDVEGRRVATLADGSVAAGEHSARWSTAGIAPGVYTVTLRAGERTIARRFVLLR
jgi:choice-of-anchor C domain-containing protein